MDRTRSKVKYTQIKMRFQEEEYLKETIPI